MVCDLYGIPLLVFTVDGNTSEVTRKEKDLHKQSQDSKVVFFIGTINIL